MNIKSVVKHNLCIGCGLCTLDKEITETIYRSKNDCMTPKSFPSEKGMAEQICPGKGYNIVEIGKQLYGNGNYDLMLGYYHSLIAAHTNAADILENASSGGAVSQILFYLLEQRIVDKVSVTQFYCDEEGVHTKSFLTNDRNEILKAQGSKYCPVDLSGLLKDLKEYDGKVAIMATPCAIAGIRNIQKYHLSSIKATIVFTISNFCGGFKSFKNIKRLAEIHHIDYHNLKSFRFRGGGQPGSLKFVENAGKTASTPYPKYVGMNGYSKMHRCFVCPDATGELADFSCGDAWLPKFQNDKNPWSVIICRSLGAKEIVDKMGKDGKITIDNVSLEEVIQSQRINLKSKKIRQKSRMRLYKIWGLQVPAFDGGYYEESTSLILELKVFLKHHFYSFIEQLRLYNFLHSFFRK